MLTHYLAQFPTLLHNVSERLPWEITTELKDILTTLIPQLGEEYRVQNGIAIHLTPFETERLILRPFTHEEMEA